MMAVGQSAAPAESLFPVRDASVPLQGINLSSALQKVAGGEVLGTSAGASDPGAASPSVKQG